MGTPEIQEGILQLFSQEFREAYAGIMNEGFVQMNAPEQIAVIRTLLGQMTTGIGTLKIMIDAKDQRITQVEGELRNKPSREEKSILDHKAIMNLKTLGSEKGAFRLWYEKFVNAFEAAIRGSRKVLDSIADKVDNGNMPEDEDEIEKWYDMIEVKDAAGQTMPVMGSKLGWETMGEAISYVLVENAMAKREPGSRRKRMDAGFSNSSNCTSGSPERRAKD